MGRPEFESDDPESPEEAPEGADEKVCSQCGKPMVIRTTWRGSFWGCTGYASGSCRNTEPYREPREEKPARGAEKKVWWAGKYTPCEKCGERPAIDAASWNRPGMDGDLVFERCTGELDENGLAKTVHRVPEWCGPCHLRFRSDYRLPDGVAKRHLPGLREFAKRYSDGPAVKGYSYDGPVAAVKVEIPQAPAQCREPGEDDDE